MLRAPLRYGEQELFNALRCRRELLHAAQQEQVGRDDIVCRVASKNHIDTVDVELGCRGVGGVNESGRGRDRGRNPLSA